MSRTVLLIGDSPFLGTIKDKIHYLIDKYDSIGINNSVRLYPIKKHIFQDMKFIPLTLKYQEIPTVTLYMYGDMIAKDKRELIDSYTFDFLKNSSEDIVKDGKLAWCGFTHDYAISYCIYKGYDKVILIGAADFISGGHYATQEDFIYAEKLKKQSKRFIEEVCSKKIKIYTLNPESFLNVSRISAEELLEVDF